MEKTFEINNKKVVAKDFDFNMMADIEEMGMDMDKVFKSPTSSCRAYLAVCLGITKEEAGLEIQEHLKNGGDLQELAVAFANAINNSDFFHQAVAEKSATKKTTKQKNIQA